MREKVTEVELPWTLDMFLLTENEDISQSCRFNWNRCLPPTRLTIPRAGLNDLIPELTYESVELIDGKWVWCASLVQLKHRRMQLVCSE